MAAMAVRVPRDRTSSGVLVGPTNRTRRAFSLIPRVTMTACCPRTTRSTAGGPLCPGRQPVHTHGLADLGHLRQALAKLVEAGDEGPVGLAEPEGGGGAGRGGG